MKKIVLFSMWFLVLASISYAKIEFYTGNVEVNSFTATADLKDKAYVDMEYILTGNEDVTIEFNNVPSNAEIAVGNQKHGNKFNLQVKGETAINVKFTEELGNSPLKQFSANPNILFNGNVNSRPIAHYRARILMPEKVGELLGSSEKPTSSQKVDERQLFEWLKSDSYATALTISWHSLDVDIDVQRHIPTIINNQFTVRNVIRNNGKEIRNVKLVQSFLEGDVEAVEPLSEFQVILAGNDIRTEWTKEMPVVDAGAAITSYYTLRAKRTGENIVFRPLEVYVDGVLAKIVEREEYFSAPDVLNLTSFTSTAESAMRLLVETPSSEGEMMPGRPIPPESIPVPEAVKEQITPAAPETGKEAIRQAAGKKNQLVLLAVFVILVALVTLAYRKFREKGRLG
ncbi:hypothetical protein HYV80_07390 [Candidatus Woesearchaeota archaeon]|nr:hypothetical protein [Candidatus Woesearchaeota archaeon]